jgi:uroporphyrinogen decarboxylase
MTSRERVLTAFAHREPDRVPFNLRPSGELVARLQTETGATDFAEHFGHDVRYVYLSLPERAPDTPVTEWTPEPDAAGIATTAEAVVALHERGLGVCGGYWPGVFEHAKHWLGDVRALTEPCDDPVAFSATLDRIQAWIAAIYGGYAQAGADIVWMGDDLGTQRSLVMSPEDYRDWYRPRHREIVQHLRSLRPDVVIAFHCCGHVTPLIRDLIEVGVDVLEAVQAETMDLAQLKREFGRDIAFWGGVGAQSVLARTTPEQVSAGVRETLRTMAPGGGYMAAPCHTMTDEVSWEAVLAFHQALAEYGAYPCPGERCT